MRFVDYLTVMLVNMAAGFVLLAFYVLRPPKNEDSRSWSVGFAMAGFVALATGGHVVLAWPLPGSYNIAFGENAVLFGVSFLGIAAVLAFGKSLVPVGIYSAVAGVAAILTGARIMQLGMTNSPPLAGIGFMLSGACGILLLLFAGLRAGRGFRVLFFATAVAAAAIWALVGYGALWGHLDSMKDWQPDSAIAAPDQERVGRTDPASGQ